MSANTPRPNSIRLYRLKDQESTIRAAFSLINCEFPTSGSGCCGETVGEAIGELHDLLEEARASSAHCKLYLWVLFVISEVKEYF